MWVGKRQVQIQEECFNNMAKTLAQDDPLWWKFHWMVMFMAEPYKILYFLNSFHRSVTAYYISKNSFSIFVEAVTLNLLVVQDSAVITLSYQSNILRFSNFPWLMVLLLHVIFVFQSQLFPICSELFFLDTPYKNGSVYGGQFCPSLCDAVSVPKLIF
jgi:hypothetical protein